MTGWTTAQIWTLILALGIGTFVLRLSFLGLLGGRTLPDWAMRVLRYTPVAVLPGLMAPLVLLPPEAGATLDWIKLTVAAATLLAGWKTGSVIWGIVGGFAALIGLTLVAG